MTENLQEITLGEALVGEVVIWKHRFVGDVLAEVKSQEDSMYTTVLADNNVLYTWFKEMQVWVDR